MLLSPKFLVRSGKPSSAPTGLDAGFAVRWLVPLSVYSSTIMYQHGCIGWSVSSIVVS